MREIFYGIVKGAVKNLLMLRRREAPSRSMHDRCAANRARLIDPRLGRGENAAIRQSSRNAIVGRGDRREAAMDRMEGNFVRTREELATLYARPDQRVINKEIDHVDALGRAFIAASPFLVLATGGAQGLDCSPKGDAPGFVQVEDDGKTLLIPDRPGNNRIDGMKNLLENPQVGIIFLAPGANETYRVNGRAAISVDPALKQRFVVNGKEPRCV